MNQSEHINELASALAKAQKNIRPAIKDSSNPFFKSKYADLPSVWSACKDALNDNGLSVMQRLDHREGTLYLDTFLSHSSGQWIKSSLPINPTKNDAQGMGSYITYMRRYSLDALVMVTSDDDDDGNAACSTNGQKTAQEAPQSTISSIQAAELKKIFSCCDGAYLAQILHSLKKNSIEQIPAHLFDRIKTAALKKADEFNNLEKEMVYA